jgi:hypothetical protein
MINTHVSVRKKHTYVISCREGMAADLRSTARLERNASEIVEGEDLCRSLNSVSVDVNVLIRSPKWGRGREEAWEVAPDSYCLL